MSSTVVHQHSGSILGSVICVKYFDQYLNGLGKYTNSKRKEVPSLSHITRQFLNFTHWMVFELFLYCVTVKAKNNIDSLSIEWALLSLWCWDCVVYGREVIFWVKLSKEDNNFFPSSQFSHLKLKTVVNIMMFQTEPSKKYNGASLCITSHEGVNLPLAFHRYEEYFFCKRGQLQLICIVACA